MEGYVEEVSSEYDESRCLRGYLLRTGSHEICIQLWGILRCKQQGTCVRQHSNCYEKDKHTIDYMNLA